MARWIVLLPLLMLLVSCDGGPESETQVVVEYEYWSGNYPDTIPYKTKVMMQKATAGINRLPVYHNDRVLYNRALNLAKERAREQGWEEYQSSMWRRETGDSTKP